MIAVGLDLSLTATGYCDPDGLCHTVKFPGKGVERLAHASEWAHKVFGPGDAEVVAIEGYAYGGANQAHQLGELGGVIRLALHAQDVTFRVIPPTVVKLYATGKGNAPKDAVYGAAIRHGSPAVDNNQGDAWWLWTIACHLLGYPQVDVTAYRTKALATLAKETTA